MLLIEDADRVEIRIADLLADLKVVVAVVDERLRVLAEVERPQPLDHDVACHGHPGALSRRSRVGPDYAPARSLRFKTRAFPPATLLVAIPSDDSVPRRSHFIIRCARRRLLPSRVAALQTTM